MIKKAILYFNLIVLVGIANAQTFECRIVENDFGYLSYQMRETSGTNTPTTTTDINDITFVIRYPSGSVNINLICSSNDYNIFDGLAGEQSYNGYDYHYWNASTVPAVNPPSNWVQNEWEEICVFEASGATGSGLFEIAPDGWDGKSLNWNQTVGGIATDFDPIISGTGITYSYPTIVYDLVWTGADATYPNIWDLASNWETECGSSGSVPTTGNNCIIPVIQSGNYPTMVAQTSGGWPPTHQPICDNLRIVSGASITLSSADLASGAQVLYTINNVLEVYGTLNIIPNSQLTISGDTYLDATECLVIQSDATGTGSFIDNGTITYGTNGSAKVQTYLVNNASAPTFHFHLVGPTVDNTGYGVQLSAFNVVNGNTYAYKYDEPADDWVNFSALTDPVQTAKGIGLSTNDGNSYTMEMTGELITGSVNSEVMTTSGDGNYLLSNPYPSAILWDDIYSDNSSVVSDQVYIYDASFSGGNYRAYNQGSGGTDDFTGYIQIGQGFFVNAITANSLSFDNGDRYHSDEPFYKSTTYYNRLDVRASGNGFTDGLLLHFYDDASAGYKNNEDVAKKMSYNENATQLWSVNDDNVNLSINGLPLNLLENNYSIPLSFICSANNNYSLNFLGTETFETGTEIWLEDKQTGAEWISVNSNSEYLFTANVNDPVDRFVIHFFGPTGINENKNPLDIEIYSHKQYAYVVNKTDEVIKKIYISTLSGKAVYETSNAHLATSKYFVSDKMGYYLVKVITDKKVYTEKLLISK